MTQRSCLDRHAAEKQRKGNIMTYVSIILKNIESAIAELEAAPDNEYANGFDSSRMCIRNGHKAFRMNAIYKDFEIFDWFTDTLSLFRLKQMRSFLREAERLGFSGYTTFKVGCSGTAHGMWAYKNESTNGYSPEGDCIFHSFRPDYNYWDVKLNGGWMCDRIGKDKLTLREIRAAVSKAGNKETDTV